MRGRVRRALWVIVPLLVLPLAARDRAWSAGRILDDRFAPADSREAAALAFSGHPEQADALLARFGRVEPAIFVRGCLALDRSGSLGASALRGLARSELEATALLRALASRRIALPSEDWVEAFFAAWREVGPIDVAAGTPVQGWFNKIASNETGSLRSVGDPFWRVGTQKFPLSKDVISVRPLATSSARKLLLVRLLPRSSTGPDAEIRGELIDELAAAEPEDITYPLMRLLAPGGERPFSESDLLALEEAVGRPRYGVSVASLYEAYLQDLKALGDSDAVSHAWWAAIAAFPDDFGTLLLRAKATQEARTSVAGGRLAAVLERVGGQAASQTSLLARLLGEQLVVRAALLRGDRAGVDAARTTHEATVALFREGKVRLAYLDGWPIPSLVRDMIDRIARDELTIFREVAQLPVRATSLPASR